MSEARPTVSDDDTRLAEAHRAIDAFVAELQAGVDDRDADVYNASFAADVLWGTPYGDTVSGCDTLHAVHQRLLPAGTGGASSRYATVRVTAPAPDVAVAQVQRVAFGPDDNPIDPSDPTTFSEIVTYVLVRRDGTWGLAAGQNTPVREKPSWRRGKPQLAKQRAAQEELVELADHDRARREWGDEM